MSEADGVPDREIERAILEELEDYPRLPYLLEVEKVEVSRIGERARSG